MSGIQELLGTVAKHSDRDGVQLVARAAHFAEESHMEFVRLDGTAYIDHSVGVATILAEWHAPPHLVAAGLLHDVPKQRYSNRPSLAVVDENFPPSVAS